VLLSIFRYLVSRVRSFLDWVNRPDTPFLESSLEEIDHLLVGFCSERRRSLLVAVITITRALIAHVRKHPDNDGIAERLDVFQNQVTWGNLLLDLRSPCADIELMPASLSSANLPVDTLVASMDAIVRGMQSAGRPAEGLVANLAELQAGKSIQLLTTLIQRTAPEWIELERAEIASARASIAAELKTMRSTEQFVDSSACFSDTMAFARERNAQVRGELENALQRKSALRLAHRGHSGGAPGKYTPRSAVDQLLTDDSFLHSVDETSDPVTDDLRRRLAEARILSMRLHAERDRLRMPTSSVLLSKAVVDKLTKDSIVGGGRWISRSGAEASTVRTELRERERERNALAKSWATIRSSERAAPRLEDVRAEITRLTREFSNMREEFAREGATRHFIGPFMEASHSLFVLFKQELRLLNKES
jgi:hypothetical protein